MPSPKFYPCVFPSRRPTRNFRSRRHQTHTHRSTNPLKYPLNPLVSVLLLLLILLFMGFGTPEIRSISREPGRPRSRCFDFDTLQRITQSVAATGNIPQIGRNVLL